MSAQGEYCQNDPSLRKKNNVQILPYIQTKSLHQTQTHQQKQSNEAAEKSRYRLRSVT